MGGTKEFPLRRSAARLLFAAALAPALSGCALSYVDGNGDTHYRGLLVHVTIPKSKDTRDVGAESVRVQSLGLSVLTGLQRTNITLGYNDDTVIVVRGNSCVNLGATALDNHSVNGRDPHDD